MNTLVKANADNIQLSLKEIVEINRDLLMAFNESEKQSVVPMFNLRRLFKIRAELIDENLFFTRNYPVFQLMSIITAVLLLFKIGEIFHLLFIVIYIALLILTLSSRVDFIEAYSRLVVGKYNISGVTFGVDRMALRFSKLLRFDFYRRHRVPDHKITIEVDRKKNTYATFGVDLISLRVHNILEYYTKDGAQVPSKKMLSSVINLVKSSQDHEAVSYGYVDYYRKSLFVLLYYTIPTILISDYTNFHTKILLYWNYLRGSYAILTHDYLMPFLVLMACVIIIITMEFYSILYGYKAADKKKQKILTYAKHIKRNMCLGRPKFKCLLRLGIVCITLFAEIRHQ